MAGKCRMALWLTAQGAEAEPFTPSAERVFEYGDAMELLLLDEIEIQDHHSESGKKRIGQWYARTLELPDHETGAILVPGVVDHRQLEVGVVGADGRVFKGHIDGLDMTGQIKMRDGFFSKGPVLIDGKSANGRSFLGAKKGDMLGNAFSREYVVTMNMYMAAVSAKLGIDVVNAALVYMDKEKGGMMFRHLMRDPALVAEGLERLETGAGTAEPRPDFPWVKGEEIHLRCRYCELKYVCAETRKQAISAPVLIKGSPHWQVIS